MNRQQEKRTNKDCNGKKKNGDLSTTHFFTMKRTSNLSGSNPSRQLSHKPQAHPVVLLFFRGRRKLLIGVFKRLLSVNYEIVIGTSQGPPDKSELIV